MSANVPTGDVWMVVLHYIRINYEEKPGSRRVPLAISHLAWKFANKVIDSKLLTLAEDVKFINKVTEAIPKFEKLIGFKKIYTASHHDFSAAKYHKYVDGKNDTITIIKSNWGRKFGGYASAALKKGTDDGIILDPDSFVFAIGDVHDIGIQIFHKAKEYENGQKAKKCIQYHAGLGPCFGIGAIEVTDKCNMAADLDNNPEATSCCSGYTFDTDFKLPKGKVRIILCGEAPEGGYEGGWGKDNRWDCSNWNWYLVEEYEVFQSTFS